VEAVSISLADRTFYNYEVWMMPSMNVKIKHLLLSASSKAMKLALHYPRNLISYNDLHNITNRATPMMYCYYKLALQLYKVFYDSDPDFEWTCLNFNQTNMSQQSNFNITRTNKLNVGLNALANRLNHLNGKIPLVWLNNSYSKFKIDCKNMFLSF
jgi:hypothetical protein